MYHLAQGDRLLLNIKTDTAACVPKVRGTAGKVLARTKEAQLLWVTTMQLRPHLLLCQLYSVNNSAFCVYFFHIVVYVTVYMYSFNLKQEM